MTTRSITGHLPTAPASAQNHQNGSVCRLPLQELAPLHADGTIVKEAQKTAAVFQKNKRKNIPLRSLHKGEEPPNGVKKASFTAPASKASLNLLYEAAKSYYLKGNYAEALRLVHTVLAENHPPALKTISLKGLQAEYLKIWSIKGLCLLKLAEASITLANASAAHEALMIFRTLLEYDQGYEIRKGIALCYFYLALCPSESHKKNEHEEKAEKAFKDAYALISNDLELVKDWVHLKIEFDKYQEALDILKPHEATLLTAPRNNTLPLLIKNQIVCYLFLSQKGDRDFYRGQTKISYERFKGLMGEKSPFALELKSLINMTFPGALDLQLDK
jgi:tetratricopeptide (TPR) repeat protein